MIRFLAEPVPSKIMRFLAEFTPNGKKRFLASLGMTSEGLGMTSEGLGMTIFYVYFSGLKKIDR